MDVDAAPYAQSMFISQSDVDTFTEEFRLNGSTDRMSWVAGFYYLQIDNETNNGLSFEATSPFSSRSFSACRSTRSVISRSIRTPIHCSDRLTSH